MLKNKKKIGIFLIVSFVIALFSLSVSATSFTNVKIYGQNWTSVALGNTGGIAKIYGTVTKINNDQNVDNGYSKIKVTAFYNGNQYGGDVIATKNKAFTIITNKPNTENVSFSAKGNQSNKDAIISGDYAFN